MKARVIDVNKDEDCIFKKKSGDLMQKSDGTKRSITYSTCLERCRQELGEAIYDNLGMIVRLRNDASHYVINVAPIRVVALLQAGVLNYERMLDQWFGRSLSEYIPHGSMYIIPECEVDGISPDVVIRRSGMSVEAIAVLRNWEETIQERAQYYQTVDYDSAGKLYYPIVINTLFGENPNSMTVELTLSDDGRAVTTSMIDPNDMWPYREIELRKELERELDLKISVNQLRGLAYIFDAMSNKIYCHVESTQGTKKYSRQYKDKLIIEIQNCPDILCDAAKKYNEIMRLKREEKKRTDG